MSILSDYEATRLAYIGVCLAANAKHLVAMAENNLKKCIETPSTEAYLDIQHQCATAIADLHRLNAFCGQKIKDLGKQ